MKKVIAAIALSTVVSMSAFAAEKPNHAGMHEHMQMMEKIMVDANGEKDPKAKRKMMKQHMESMQKGMHMMGNGKMMKNSSMPMKDRMDMMEGRMDMMQSMMGQVVSHTAQIESPDYLSEILKDLEGGE